jgi:hypothetical protein
MDQPVRKDELRQALLWMLVFIVATVWPVVLCDYPAGQDTPNHLARAFLLLHPDDLFLARHFEITWHAVPNLIWDGFAVLAGRILPLLSVLKIFMVLGLALTAFGIGLINRTIAGRWTWMPLLGVPFLFHAGYAKGFLGFNVAIGLCLIAIAIWQMGNERQWGRRLILAWLLSTILFFAHLMAWGIYGLTLLGLALSVLYGEWRKHGPKAFRLWVLRLMRDGTQVLPPIAVSALATMLRGQEMSLVGRIAEFHDPIIRLWEARRLIDVGGDLPSVPILVVVALFLFYLLLWRKTLRFDFTFAVPIGLLVFFFFVFPNQIFATHLIVWRIALGATFLAIASGVPTVPITAPAARRALTAILAATVFLSGWQAYSFVNADAERRDFLSLIARVPAGDTLFAIHSRVKSSSVKFDRIGLYHFGADAVRTRKIMVQSLFANPSQQPIRYREAQFDMPRDNTTVFMERLSTKFGDRGLSLSEYVAAFDWVAVHGLSPVSDRFDIPLSGFERAGERGSFRLYCKALEHLDPASGRNQTVCPDGQAP